MVAYKDILEAFGGNTSYADRFQSAALKGDTEGMSNIRNEYNVSIGKNKETPKTKTDTDNNNNYTPVPTQTYTPEGYTPQQQNQNQNLGNWNYGSDTAERQEEIVRNLNEAYAQDPSRFSDWATFANNFNYDYGGRSDKERETMRNWYESQVGQTQQMDYNNPNNTDYFFNQLLNGGTLQGEGAAATQAMNRYKNFQYLSGMTPDQIASAVTSGSLNGVGQEMQDLKNYAPALYAQVQSILQGKTQVDDINSIGDSIYNGLTKTETNDNYKNYDMTSDYVENASIIKQYNESLYKKIEGLGGDTAAYVDIVASLLQNPNIQSSKNEVEDLEGEVNKIQEQIYTIGDTVREKLGSEAPEDLVSAYISNQTKQLQNQLRTAQNSLLVAQGKLDNQLSEVETMIDAINYGINYQMKLDAANEGKEVDTNDYTSTDPDRLQQIQNNLDKYANGSEVYVFRDRNAFDEFFKYTKRVPAQQRVLDDYWNANADKLKDKAQKAWQDYLKSQRKGSGGGGGGGGSDDYSGIKKALMEGTFSGSWNQTNLKKYGYTGGADDLTILKAIGQTSTPDEISQIVSHLANEGQITTLVSGYILNTHKSEIQSKLDGMTGINKGKKRKEYIAELYTSLGLPTNANDKRVNSLLLKFGYGEEEKK